MDRGHAEQERRLGRLRRRQYLSLSQSHSLRRSWRAARSADRRRLRALRLDAGAARRQDRDERRGSSAASIICITDQMEDGSWFGRWGANYIYGTWSSLCALNAAGLPHEHDAYRRAVNWLVSIQNEDGGWGEDLSQLQARLQAAMSRRPRPPRRPPGPCSALMAAGDVDHPAVARGVAYLQATQNGHGLWDEARYHGDGFPARLLSALSWLCENSSRSGRSRATAICRRANSKRVQVGL